VYSISNHGEAKNEGRGEQTNGICLWVIRRYAGGLLLLLVAVVVAVVVILLAGNSDMGGWNMLCWWTEIFLSTFSPERVRHGGRRLTSSIS